MNIINWWVATLSTATVPGMLWGPPQTHTHTQQKQQQQMHVASVHLHYTPSTQNAFGNCLNCTAANNAVFTIHLNPSRCVFYLHWHHSHQPAWLTSHTEKLLNLKTWGLVLNQHPSSHLVWVHVWHLAVHWLFARTYPVALVHISAANNSIIICTVSILKMTPFCCTSTLLLVQLNSTLDLGLQALTSSHRVKREERGGNTFTHQIQHRFHNITVANLSDLDQSDENSKFHFDIPDRNRWIDNPSREDHWTWAGHHHRLTGGGSGDCSRVLPVTWRRLSVRERHRTRHCHRSLACHVHPDRAALRERLVTRLPPCDELNHCSEASRRNEREEEEDSRSPEKQKQNTNKNPLCVS